MYYAEVEEMGEKIRKGEDIRCVMSVNDGDAYTKSHVTDFRRRKVRRVHMCQGNRVLF